MFIIFHDRFSLNISLRVKTMGFLKGSASFVRFRVEGELPNSPLEFIAEQGHFFFLSRYR